MDLQAVEPHTEEGTAYRPKQTYSAPSQSSKTVLSIVKIGPTFHGLSD